MEMYKFQYMELVLNKRHESSAEYLETLENERGQLQALDFYVDTFQMNGDDFRKCLVRDGFFMIGLFLRNAGQLGKKLHEFNDMLFDIKWMKPRLERDMLLFENQIPLFVLRKLAAFTNHRPDEEEFVRLALGYFEFNGEGILHYRLTRQLDSIPHLLGLVYHALLPETPRYRNMMPNLYAFISSAVELDKVGVKFRKPTRNSSFDDICFFDGVIRIPRLVIDYNTESFFRKLVAYERYSMHYSLHQITDYLRVMDCLINSSKDVELLRNCGIIDNRIGGDVNVSIMFQQLCSGVYFDQGKFYYAEMFDEVNTFCQRTNQRSEWEKVEDKYFRSPWSCISFLAALAFLVLTLLQTIFSGLAYYQSRS